MSHRNSTPPHAKPWPAVRFSSAWFARCRQPARPAPAQCVVACRSKVEDRPFRASPRPSARPHRPPRLLAGQAISAGWRWAESTRPPRPTFHCEPGRAGQIEFARLHLFGVVGVEQGDAGAGACPHDLDLCFASDRGRGRLPGRFVCSGQPVPRIADGGELRGGRVHLPHAWGGHARPAQAAGAVRLAEFAVDAHGAVHFAAPVMASAAILRCSGVTS